MIAEIVLRWPIPVIIGGFLIAVAIARILSYFGDK